MPKLCDKVLPFRLPDQTFFAFKRKAVLQNPLRGYSPLQKIRIVPFLLDLQKCVSCSVFQTALLILRVEDLKLHDDRCVFRILRLHHHIVATVSAQPIPYLYYHKTLCRVMRVRSGIIPSFHFFLFPIKRILPGTSPGSFSLLFFTLSPASSMRRPSIPRKVSNAHSRQYLPERSAHPHFSHFKNILEPAGSCNRPSLSSSFKIFNGTPVASDITSAGCVPYSSRKAFTFP